MQGTDLSSRFSLYMASLYLAKLSAASQTHGVHVHHHNPVAIAVWSIGITRAKFAMRRNNCSTSLFSDSGFVPTDNSTPNARSVDPTPAKIDDWHYDGILSCICLEHQHEVRTTALTGLDLQHAVHKSRSVGCIF
jgi:hypothetical protein